jgi:hypothetical protein
VNEYKPLPRGAPPALPACTSLPPPTRGLHSSTFRLNVSAFCGIRGCIYELFFGCLAGGRGHQGVFRVYFVSETAQVEMKSGRVYAPAANPAAAANLTSPIPCRRVLLSGLPFQLKLNVCS